MKTAKVKIRILVNVGVNMQDGYREFHAGDNGDIAFWADEAEVVECL